MMIKEIIIAGVSTTLALGVLVAPQAHADVSVGVREAQIVTSWKPFMGENLKDGLLRRLLEKAEGEQRDTPPRGYGATTQLRILGLSLSAVEDMERLGFTASDIERVTLGSTVGFVKRGKGIFELTDGGITLRVQDGLITEVSSDTPKPREFDKEGNPTKKFFGDGSAHGEDYYL